MPTNMEMNKDYSNKFLRLKEASRWASEYMNRKITPENISYLIQYGRVKKHMDSEGIKVNIEDLKKYYDEIIKKKMGIWKERLGKDLNWNLSFDNLKESDRTKHVHRLHPYKGKFIPQLVEYFIDEHLNEHKKETFFKGGGVLLDPFMGSGTTIIQCSESGFHSIGIEISKFNCQIAMAKANKYEIEKLKEILKYALDKTVEFTNSNFDNKFDKKIKNRISEFNKKHFPSPEYKIKVNSGEINEEEYAKNKLDLFFKQYSNLFRRSNAVSLNEYSSSFIPKWFSGRVRKELLFYLKLVHDVKDEKIKNLMQIILSRTSRSCRSTTHSDLATLTKPQFKPYYCVKHKKICIPINSIIRHLKKNTFDTLKRINDFSKLRKNVDFVIIHGNSKKVDILEEIIKQKIDKTSVIFKKVKNGEIDGIFTSPPYVGQIDYHEQHAYAYELFGIPRKDDDEIGSLSAGKGKIAQERYIDDISAVLRNVGKYVKHDGHFFIVANDSLNLYERIAEKGGLKIINKFKRPVLNRTERDKQPYAETIFHMKKT